MIKLPSSFIQLPVRFDVERLLYEVARFDQRDWRPHPSGFAGNDALLLITAGGGDNDELTGQMAPTANLDKSPYFKQVLGSFKSVIGRSRLMRLGGESSVNEHVDVHPYWHHHLRVHIPLITDPDIAFWCGGQYVHMAAGECWVFDHHKPHKVVNPSNVTRIHLVFDTTGSSWFRRLIAGGHQPFGDPSRARLDSRLVPFQQSAPEERLKTENFNFQGVMAAGDFDSLIDGFQSQLEKGTKSAPESLVVMRGFFNDLKLDWRTTWSYYGGNWKYSGVYRRLISRYQENSSKLFTNNLSAPQAAGLAQNLNNILDVALVAPRDGRVVDVPQRSVRAARRLANPVFLVSAPRSGSSFLFESLAVNESLVTLGGEGHRIYESFSEFNPLINGRLHNGMYDSDASVELVSKLTERLCENLIDVNGVPYEQVADHSPGLRMLEKTPKNAMRISFLATAFPDATFIYLYRAPGPNVSSIFRAWQSRRFVTYRNLPAWQGPPWSMVLPAGWQSLAQDDLAGVAAFQWSRSNQQIINDLSNLDRARWCAIDYDQLVANPEKTLRWLCEQLGVPFDDRLEKANSNGLPLSRHTLTPPDPQKWLADRGVIAPFLDDLTSTWSEIERFLARSTASTPVN